MNKITTYTTLNNHLQTFISGKLPLIILTGPPGTGKTTALHKALGIKTLGINQNCYITGNHTPYSLYRSLSENRNRPIIIDEITDLRDRRTTALLYTLYQDTPTRTITWEYPNSAPISFQTTSPICLTIRSWQELDSHLATKLQNRAHTLSFEPTPTEVHQQATTWFTNQQILTFIEQHLPQIKLLNFNHYNRALDLHNADIDWQPTLTKLLDTPPIPTHV